jgi:hypothetical protein
MPTRGAKNSACKRLRSVCARCCNRAKSSPGWVGLWASTTCVSCSTTVPNRPCWSSQVANRCTPTYDRRGITWTPSAPAATGRWSGTRRGRPWRRLSCQVARHRLRWRIRTAMGIWRCATLASNARLGHCGSSWRKVHNSACATSLRWRPAQNDGLEPSSRLGWLGADCMTSSSFTSSSG